MKLKITDDTKAEAFLRNQLPEDSYKEAVESIYESIPKASRESYGDTKIQQTANYHLKWGLKETVVSTEELLSGGGMFRIMSHSTLVEANKKTAFTILPEGEDKLRVIFPKRTDTVLVGKSEFIREIELGRITECYKTQGRDMAVKIKKLSKEEKAAETDFKEAVLKVRKFFKKYKIETARDLMSELDAISMAMPEEFFNDYPQTEEGRIIAVAAYIEQNKDEVADVLKSSYSTDEFLFTGLSNIVDTGSIFITTKDTEYFTEDRTLVMYHEKETDMFYLVVISGDLKKSAIGTKIALGILAAASIVVLAPIAVVAGGTAALGTAVVGLTGAKIAASVAIVGGQAASNFSKKNLVDSYAQFTREELQALTDDKTFVSDKNIWESMKYLYL